MIILKSSKIVLVVVLLFINCFPASAQCTSQLSGITDDIYKIQAIGANKAFAFSRTSILWTSDGGTHWNKFTVGGDTLLQSFSFANADTGYVGGRTSPFGPGVGVMYKTTNGGLSWTKTTANIPWGFSHLYDMQFIDGKTGWAVHAGGVAKTTDGGATWKDKGGYPATQKTIQMLNYNVGYTVGGNNTIYKTIDGGENWTSLLPIGSGSGYSSISFVNETTGYITGIVGDRILKTTNGGITFDSIYQTEQMGFQKIYFLDNLTGYFLNKDLYKSTDGGLTWNIECSAENGYFIDLIFYNSCSGYIAGTSGIIKKIINNCNPTSSVSPTSNSLYKVYPNPTKDKVLLDFTTADKIELNVRNIYGEKVIHIEKHHNTGQSEINLQHLPDGIYFLHINSEIINEFVKLVKE